MPAFLERLVLMPSVTMLPSILKQTGDLELVRQVLRHESLAMALRYAHIAKPAISRKVQGGSPLDNLRAGR